MSVRLHQRFKSIPSTEPAIPGTEVGICSMLGLLNFQSGDGKWLMISRCSSSAGRLVKRSLDFDESCSDFEGAEGCQQLKQHVLDNYRYCAMPFLELSGLNGCYICGNFERQLPGLRVAKV